MVEPTNVKSRRLGLYLSDRITLLWDGHRRGFVLISFAVVVVVRVFDAVTFAAQGDHLSVEQPVHQLRAI